MNTPDLTNLITNPTNINLAIIFKTGFLIMVALYTTFTFMLFNQVRALNRIIFFPSSLQSSFLKILTFIYFLLTLSLFFLTLVIV